MSALTDFMRPSGLLTRAFDPLRRALDRLAETAVAENRFCDWLIRSGKGGLKYPDYPDTSLYRHCMDVALFAAMLFFYAWQAGRIPGLAPEDEQGAETALKDLFLIAFTHDADKAAGDKTRSPSLEQVNQIFQDLQADTWSRLKPQECFALVSGVEDRGFANALVAVRPPLFAQKLCELVKEGDGLISTGSRNGKRALVEAYNKRLPALAAQYGVPKEPLRLLEFRENAVILYKLQQVFLDELYQQGWFPLICLLDGERFHVTVPTEFEPTGVLKLLGDDLADRQPSLKRNPTNGELTLLETHSARELLQAVRSSQDPRLLTVHRKDWEFIENYLRSWSGDIGNLNLLPPGEGGKLVLPCAPRGAGEDAIPSERYGWALAVATALRADAKSETLFKERLKRLECWKNGRIAALRQALPGIALDTLDKNTRQTLFAMQAAVEIQTAEELENLVMEVYGPFPEPPLENQGAQAIVQGLLAQCGLAEQDNEPTADVYTSKPTGGACLLCGMPADKPISTEMWLVGVKSSAFNNRIGHRKHLWSQSEKNYICSACLKRQAVLHATLTGMEQRPSAMPLLVATPFRGLVKPAGETGPNAHAPPFPLTSFLAVKRADQAWKQVLPWNRDISESFPLMLESVDSDSKGMFNNMVSAMYRMAVLAAHSGNPVHVFTAAQREVKAAFLFEPAPALIQSLIRDLSLPSEPGAIRRERLPELIDRLELFNTALRTNYGHDMLAALPRYGWWAVAWVDGRLEGNQKADFRSMVDMARNQRVYQMNEYADIEQIALLAANIQKAPKGDRSNKPSNSETVLALTTALSMLNIGKRKHMGNVETIAAMAWEVQKTLDRRNRDVHFRQAGPFEKRCQEFAEAVFNFMHAHEGKQPLDAQFQRFMLAAYAQLFTRKSQEISKKPNLSDNPDEDSIEISEDI